MAMRVAIGIGPAQSNEAGVPGTAFGQSRTSYGYPMLDPTGVRSMWPLVSELCGRTGILSLILNRAVGSTGLCNYWVGNVRTWAAGLFVQQGSYVISGGKLWKVIDANVSNSDVYGTSTVAPSLAAGADNVLWADLGATTSEDVNGAIYPRTSSRFDPNGAMAASRDAILAAKNVDRRFMLISIGQGDKTAGMSLAQYQGGYEQAVRFALDAGIEVLAGLTVIGRTAGLPEWMRDVGDPAWQGVCNKYAGTRGFHVGANLYRELASNPDDAYNTNVAVGAPPVIGLLPDLLHMDSPLFNLAAECQADAIVRACANSPL